MNIYTSYFGNYKNIPQEYQCISIANSKPQSLFIPTWKEVMPKWSIVKSLKNKEITFGLFEQMYLCQLFQTYQINDKQKIEELKNYLESMGDNIVLLCWEKDAFYCHRYVLMHFLDFVNESYKFSWQFQEELQGSF